MSDGVGPALLEARSPRTPSQRILLVALAHAGIGEQSALGPRDSALQ